jgi:hypothetical protein
MVLIILLRLESSFFTSADSGTICKVVYTWEYMSQTWRDTERVGITESQFGDLALLLRKRVKDYGRAVTSYRVGDAITTNFFLREGYIPADRVTVYVGNAIASGYAFNTSSNTVEFSTAPSAQSSIRIEYMVYDYDDQTFDQFIVEALANYNRLFATSISTSTAPTNESVRQMVIMLGERAVFYNEMLNSNRDSVVWRDEEKSVSRTQVPRNYIETLKMLDEQIDKQVKTGLMRSITGYALAGGNTQMVKFEAVDWTTANG